MLNEKINFKIKENIMNKYDKTIEEKTEIIDYLKEELPEILTTLSDKTIYIHRKSDGELSHTTNKEIAVKKVAENYLNNEFYRSIYTKNYIFEPEKDKVKEFLMGFNLSKEEAEEIISNIGVYSSELPENQTNN